MSPFEKISKLTQQTEIWRDATITLGLGALVFSSVAIVFSQGVALLANPSLLIGTGLAVSAVGSFALKKLKKKALEETREEACPGYDQMLVAPSAQTAIVKAQPSQAFAPAAQKAVPAAPAQGGLASAVKPSGAKMSDV